MQVPVQPCEAAAVTWPCVLPAALELHKPICADWLGIAEDRILIVVQLNQHNPIGPCLHIPSWSPIYYERAACWTHPPVCVEAKKKTDIVSNSGSTLCGSRWGLLGWSNVSFSRSPKKIILFQMTWSVFCNDLGIFSPRTVYCPTQLGIREIHVK